MMFFFKTLLDGIADIQDARIRRSTDCKRVFEPASSSAAPTNLDCPLDKVEAMFGRLVSRMNKNYPSITQEEQDLFIADFSKLYTSVDWSQNHEISFVFLSYDATIKRSCFYQISFNNIKGTSMNIFQVASPVDLEIEGADSFICLTSYESTDNQIKNGKVTLVGEVPSNLEGIASLSFVYYPFFVGLSDSKFLKTALNYIEAKFDEIMAELPFIDPGVARKNLDYFRTNGQIDNTEVLQKFIDMCYKTPTPSPAPQPTQ